MKLFNTHLSNNGTQLWIVFDTRDDGQMFLDYIKDKESLKIKGYISSEELFCYLNVNNPYSKFVGWYIDELMSAESLDYGIKDDGSGNTYGYVSIPHAHRINKRIANYILESSELKKKIKELEEDRLSKGTLVIRTEIFLKEEKYQKLYSDLKDQMENGILLIPPYCTALYIPEGVKVEFIKK